MRKKTENMYIDNVKDTSKDDIAVKVDHVTMAFNMANEQLNSLKEYFIKISKRELFFKEFVALDDVSFEVKKGDVYGIVGTNGSGKSTILKIIAGVLEPTKGNCIINGDIAPLIELGAGFDMELTARENIYLNGSLLGYSHSYIDEHFDEIVDFAELWDFLDIPMKNYSSGMVARIAFAIATIIVPDILIVDEALSVGDVFFREKCQRRITTLIEQHQTTVLFVSHSMDEVKKLCRRAIWIEKGHKIMEGDVDEVCSAYYSMDYIDYTEKTKLIPDIEARQYSISSPLRAKDVSYVVDNCFLDNDKYKNLFTPIITSKHKVNTIIENHLQDHKLLPSEIDISAKTDEEKQEYINFLTHLNEEYASFLSAVSSGQSSSDDLKKHANTLIKTISEEIAQHKKDNEDEIEENDHPDETVILDKKQKKLLSQPATDKEKEMYKWLLDNIVPKSLIEFFPQDANEVLNRELVASLIYLIALYKRPNLAKYNNKSLTGFPDYKLVSKDFVPAMSWCVSHNIMGGVTLDNGSKILDPKAPITCAAMIKMITCLYKDVLHYPDDVSPTSFIARSNSYDYVIRHSIMNNNDSGMFRAVNACSKAEFLQVLWNCVGQPEITDYFRFNDVSKNDWFYGCIGWAVQHNLIEISTKVFMPENIILREDAIAILHKFINLYKDDSHIFNKLEEIFSQEAQECLRIIEKENETYKDNISGAEKRINDDDIEIEHTITRSMLAFIASLIAPVTLAHRMES